MGTKQSKQVEGPAGTPIPPAARETKITDIPLSASVSAPTAAPSANGDGSKSSSTGDSDGCPMKLPDGSYLKMPGFGSLFGRGGGKDHQIAAKKYNASRDASSSADETPPLTTSGDECPVKHSSNDTLSEGDGGCPVKGKQPKQYDVYSREIDPTNQMPSVANQLPSPQQTASLQTGRISSSIAKGGLSDGATWTYPSPQMFYNALSRKGKLGGATEEEMESVVAIHNNMNEGTWAKVLEWEETLNGGGGAPKLLKFLGRPADLSPKARLKHYLLDHPLPFDRHDWTVLRPNGEEVRYVIDYYHDDALARTDAGSAMPDMRDRGAVKSLMTDVRPALDGPSEFWGRCVTMPLARRGLLGDARTNFEPMPMRPSESLKANLAESLELWANIQKAVASSGGGGADACDSNSLEEGKSEITSEQAHEIATSFARVLDECREAKVALNRCETDEECAEASVAFSMCSGSFFCPLQHGALVGALKEHGTGGGSAETDDAKVEKALEVLGQCVAKMDVRAGEAKAKHPRVFDEVLGKQ